MFKTAIAILTAFNTAVIAIAPMSAQAKSANLIDDLEVGIALVCDSQRQAERYIALLSEDADNALALVNAEENNPDACAEVNLAYIRGARLHTVRTKDAAFAIVEILAIGVADETGLRPISPAIFIALFGIDERIA